MAIVVGTNAGFVVTAPTENPRGNIAGFNTFSEAVKDTSPATAIKVTEIGWYCDRNTEEANFEVGIYSDEGNDEPEERLEVNTTNAKGTTDGWKVVTGLNWTISPSTVYWIAAQTADGTAFQSGRKPQFCKESDAKTPRRRAVAGRGSSRK